MGANDAGTLLVDVRTGSLLLREVRRQAVTRAFGIPPEEQSILGTAILVGAAVTVARGVLAPWPRLSGADAAMGGAVLNEGFRSLAGPPSRAMPLAGALIAVAVASHAVRPMVAGAAHEARTFGHAVRAALRTGYLAPRPAAS